MRTSSLHLTSLRFNPSRSQSPSASNSFFHSRSQASTSTVKRQKSIIHQTRRSTSTIQNQTGRKSDHQEARKGRMATTQRFPEYPKKDYENATRALRELVSNRAVLKIWEKQRKEEHTQQMTENPAVVKNTDDHPVIMEMKSLLTFLDLKVEKLPMIHITGTKGKGSTAAFIESILRRAGKKTGLYTSPHLVDFTERIKINGLSISQDMFAKHFWETWDTLAACKNVEKMPIFFRFITLLGFKIFLEEKVDVAIIEVGIGGRTDSTNVHPSPLSCGITPIGYDHVELLGDTLSQIAWEKAGIMRKGRPTFTVAEQKEETFLTLKEYAKNKETPLIIVPPFSAYDPPPVLGLQGEHQRVNAALAIEMCRDYLSVNFEQLPSTQSSSLQSPSKKFRLPSYFVEGLSKVQWAGRCQIIPNANKDILYYIDGAHTIESLDVCIDWFEKSTKGTTKEERVLLFSCKDNRNANALLTSILSKGYDFGLVVLTNIDTEANNTNEDGWEKKLESSWKEIKQDQNQQVTSRPSLADALRVVDTYKRTQKVHVLVTGSLYLVGAFFTETKINVDSDSPTTMNEIDNK